MTSRSRYVWPQRLFCLGLLTLGLASLAIAQEPTTPPATPATTPPATPAATPAAEPATPPAAETATPATEPVATSTTEPTAPSTEPTAAAEPAPAPAAAGPSTGDLKVAADTMWVIITGFLVFFMNLGFACVESGMCRAKNCVNILSKNFIVFAVTTIGFWLLGWGIMFGGGSSELAKYVGTEGLWMIKGADNSPAVLADYKGAYPSIGWTGVPLMVKFFFQLVFAGTAATIVSGAVAERIKYSSFIVFSFIMAIAIYPVVGHWVWGGGWMQSRGFVDFAGCTQVHSIGGWAALAGIIMLGPRIGKYGADGKVNAIPGHNLTAATIGCLILWFGWFGFNPGSTMAADPVAIGEIAVTTNMAAAAATLTATLTCWMLLGKPDLGMTLNGCLAGLVGITASCAFVTVEASLIIGAICGVIVVFSVLFFDKLKIDDPVGATSVHLVCGVLGTVFVGLFSTPDRLARSGNALHKAGLFYGGGTEQLVNQLIGIGATAGYVLVTAFIAWAILKFTMGIRVSENEEMEGLDIGEHGNEAYHGFVMSSLKEGHS
ncbi:MAG: ammonium transporter [Pirellulaceae bacterium]|nr:ammonium transporter [Pirellulaceae bacterium]